MRKYQIFSVDGKYGIGGITLIKARETIKTMECIHCHKPIRPYEWILNLKSNYQSVGKLHFECIADFRKKLHQIELDYLHIVRGR